MHVEFHLPGLPRSGRFIQSLTLFKAGGGSGDPNLFLQISFSWVEISLHVEFHPPGLPRSGRFIQSLTLFKTGVGGVK